MLVYEIFAAGLLLLVVGAESLLRGAAGLSRLLRLSPRVVSVVVVSLGSAAPQLFAAMQAVHQGAPDIAMGSIVGSSIFNLLFVLGAAALFRPLPGAPMVVFRDGGSLLLASLALVIITREGVVTRAADLALLGGFALYLVLSFATDWRRPVPLSLAEGRALTRNHAPRADASVVLMVLGLLCLFFGARFTVEGAAAIARTDRVPPAIVGLTIVGMGTALPGLFAALAATARGQTNAVAGRILGANVLNILFVLGLGALVRPLSVPESIVRADVYVLAASSGIVVAMMLPGWRITRGQGLLLLACFAGYVGFLAWRQGMLGFH